MPAQRLTSDLLTPGTMLGRYELVKRLAIGGMAELYLARASGIEGFQKLVALKRILPQYAADEQFIRMFLDEARLAANLQHANIAQVYDIGQSPHGLFFTMELVHGEDARQLLRDAIEGDDPLPLCHALTITAGTAAALHAAHEKCGLDGERLGIVHRDVSPANILVSFDGCVKLIDFGVAKASARESRTIAGTLKGKIAYLSPEQCLGEQVDARTDVFGLGVVLYELTTNRRLFAGDNEFATMKRIVEGDIPPPTSVRPDYPPALAAIVGKALALHPADRYQSAQELQLALEAFARDSGHVMSSVKLGAFMRERYADKLAAWSDVLFALSNGSDVEIELSGLPDRPEPASALGDESAPPGGSVETWMFRGVESEALVAGEPSPMTPEPEELPRGRRWTVPLGAAAAIAAAVAVVLFFGVESAAAPVERATEPAAVAAPPIAPLAEPVELPQAAPAAVPVEVAPDPEPREVRRSRAGDEHRPRRSRTRVRPTATVEPAAPAPSERRWDPDSALPPP